MNDRATGTLTDKHDCVFGAQYPTNMLYPSASVRPQVACFRDGRVLILTNTGVDGRVRDCVRAWDVTDPTEQVERVMYTHTESLLDYEPSLDQVALLERDEAQMIVATMRRAGALGGERVDLAAQLDAVVISLPATEPV